MGLRASVMNLSVKWEGRRVPLPTPCGERHSWGPGKGRAALGQRQCCGPEGGRGNLAKRMIFHFCPSFFRSRHKLETEAVLRWDRKMKRPCGYRI